MKLDPMPTMPPAFTRGGVDLNSDLDPAGEGAELVPAASEPRRPNTLRLLISHHGTALAPWGWMVAADVTATIAHFAAPTLWQAALTAAGASALVAVWGLSRIRETELQKRIKTLRTRRRVQTTVRRSVAAGSAWEVLAAGWTPTGPHGVMQFALLGGGLVLAAPHLWRNRRRPETPAKPVAEIAAPVEDPRVSRFRVQFCAAGPLREARIHDVENIVGGFRFSIELSLAHRGKFRDVETIMDDIAALFDVPTDNVSVELAENRSARRAVVTVLTETKAHERDELWDGVTSYNPATGTVDLGRFADSSTSRWQLHAPGSGACGGICVGNPGSGKTGTLHVIAAEAGLAKLCTSCAAEASCNDCDMRRIISIWLADPQRQPFGVWQGRADLSAWGPLASVRMLTWMHAGMRHRADALGSLVWTDHLGRANTGKGWFDPTPDFPMILGVIDEWPIIANDPELAQFAIPLAEEIEDEGRKVGVRLLLGSQDADVGSNGADRGFLLALGAVNALAHRTDNHARRNLNLEGHPADLPEGVHGVGYLRGPDKRSGIVHRTKHLPEYLKPGQHGIDVREIAERIAADPITYDPAFLKAISQLGYTGQGQILDDGDGWDPSVLLDDHQDRADPQPEQEQESPVSTHSADPVRAYEVSQVREALGKSSDADVYDLMVNTRLSALDVTRALDVLISDGAARQDMSGRYAPCQ